MTEIKFCKSRFQLAVLLTCHNRKPSTLRCLEALYEPAALPNVSIETYLVDDGSTDGTGEAVALQFPSVQLLRGDGSLFWGGGMRMAYSAAQPSAPDAYLWLNDDTYLFPDALPRLLELWAGLRAENPALILVGATKDPEWPKSSYGGFRFERRWGRPRFERIEVPALEPLPCQTMNGNCVLVTSEAAQILGGIDPLFPHAIGDLDYGLRASRAGIKVLLAPGWVGTCGRNPLSGTWKDSTLSFRDRWRRLTGTKGLPPAAWWAFCRRHLGPYAPVSFLSPYVRLAWSTFRGRDVPP